MNTLVVYQKHTGSAYSYYRFIRELIERFAREQVREMFFYRPDIEVKNGSGECIFFLPVPEYTGFGLTFWYYSKLPKIARKTKAGKIIYLNALPGKFWGLPQVNIFTDLEFITKTQHLSGYQKYLKKALVKRLRYSEKIITYSHHAKKTLNNFIFGQNLFPEIEVISAVANYTFMERSFNEKEIRKDNLTSGEEYFLAKISFDNEAQFITLLKAFTVFKSWQKSSMKLVVLGLERSMGLSLKRKLTSYKHKADVIVLGEEHIDVYPEIVSAAYAYLLLTEKDADLLPAMEAMQSRTLFMSYPLSSVKEIAGEAPVEISKKDYETIGQAMIDVYKNEDNRDRKIEKGSEIISNFDFEISKQKLFKVLLP